MSETQVVHKGNPDEQELWINVYKDIPPCLHLSKEVAESYSVPGRIARIKVVFKKGRFDE